MKNPRFIFILAILLSIFLVGEAVATEARLMVGKKGMFAKKDIYLRIVFSDSHKSLEPTNQSANSGDYYYFLFMSAGDWKLDQDFLENKLPGITFQQDDAVFQIARSDPVFKDNKISQIHISVGKELDISQDFSVHFKDKDTQSKVDFSIPEDIWPGYTRYYGALVEGQSLLNNEKRIEAFRILDEVLLEADAKKFSFYDDMLRKRAESYSSFYNEIREDFTEIAQDPSLSPQDVLDAHLALDEHYKLFFDSLVVDSARFEADPELLTTYNYAIEGWDILKKNIDNEKRSLDYSMVESLVNGGWKDFEYKLLLDGLFWLARSQDLNLPWDAFAPLPDTVQYHLDYFQSTNQLADKMEAMRRITDRNYKENKPIIPDDIVSNLIRNADSCSVPKAEAILAVDYYYREEPDMARSYVTRAMKISGDIELNTWLSDMETLILFQQSDSHPKVLELLNDGSSHLRQGKLDKAFLLFQQAEIMAPQLPVTAYNIGLYHLINGDTIKAITYFRRSIDFDSTFTSSYRKLYLLNISIKDWAEAISVLKKALNSADYWEYNYYLAYCCMETDKLDEAFNYIEKAVQINPGNYFNYILKGDIYLFRSDYGEAKASYNHATRIDPNNQIAYDRLEQLKALEGE